MGTPKMHANEVDIDPTVVRRLLEAQHPQWSDLPITAVQSTGTVNAIYRIGDDLYARLPRLQKWAQGLEQERKWLPRLAPLLSLQIPQPLAIGEPAAEFPFHWAVYQWIEGQPYADELVDDECQAATDLANFVLDLRAIDTATEAPRAGRKPLRELDVMTRAAIEASSDVIAKEASAAAWESALESPAWTGTPVWIHTDLLRPNLLVDGGRLRAVIDFGGVGVGDPAADVIAAWSVFGAAGRARFRKALDVDDGTWNRARGFALHQAALIIPYYRESNPAFVALAKRTIEQVLADSET